MSLQEATGDITGPTTSKDVIELTGDDEEEDTSSCLTPASEDIDMVINMVVRWLSGIWSTIYWRNIMREQIWALY